MILVSIEYTREIKFAAFSFETHKLCDEEKSQNMCQKLLFLKGTKKINNHFQFAFIYLSLFSIKIAISFRFALQNVLI